MVVELPPQIFAFPTTTAVGGELTVKPTIDDVTEQLHALLTTQSKPEEAKTVSAVATLLICKVAEFTPLQTDPLSVDPLERLTPFLRH
jgi:hypothetical protein